MADLEEVDVEQQLKQAEESGDETGSIILSEKSDIDSDDDEEEEDMQLDEDNKINEDDIYYMSLTNTTLSEFNKNRGIENE